MHVVELEIFTPRWGHEDTYEVTLEQDALKIRQGIKTARLVWQENLDPKWEGESLTSIFGNDSIYPPVAFDGCLEYAWKAWRNGDLTGEAVAQELKALAEWLNLITKSKPRSSFWSGYF